jgi:uncharacterized membrane-anchored protein
MSSTWRNKETKKSNNISHSTVPPIIENFKNIPMFEVLQPSTSTTTYISSNTTSTSTPHSEKTTEGFDIMGDSYFQNCKRYIRLNGVSGINEIIGDLKKFIQCSFQNPVEKLDESIENTIFSILYAMLLMTDKQCESETVLEKQTKDKAFAEFWWARGDVKNVFTQPFTTMSDAQDTQYAQDAVEGFTLEEEPYLRKTVDSFKQNHFNFIKTTDIYNKVAQYYVSELNERETKLLRRMTDTELFQFNNYFDNQLNYPEVQSKILKIKIPSTQTTKTTYRNTMNDYKKYYKTTARFKIYNTQPIVYYTFNNQYFDLSENNIPSPPSASSGNGIDRNYAFSIDFFSSKTVSIQSYLDDVLTHYASIFVRKNNMGSYRINTLKSRIGTVYANLLNYLEFQFFRMYGTFFNEYHIALFNHIFFVLLNQTPDTNTSVTTINLLGGENDNPYNKTDSPYLYFGKQEMRTIYQLLFNEILLDKPQAELSSNNSSKLPYLYTLESPPESEEEMDTQKPYLYDYMLLSSSEMMPIDGVLIYPDSMFSSDTKNILSEYILLPDPPFEVEPDMKKYYVDVLSDCEREQLAKKNKIKSYAKIIKEELYKILLVPVSIYVAYNFYYLFFFKDCADPAKDYNKETGDTIYKNTCENCSTPVFPDVESYFHYYEEHNLDFFFELVFKPVKFIYTSLNTIKALFRKEFGIVNTTIPKDEYPYIFLFACFAFFYTYFLKNYQYILTIFKHIIGLDFENMNKTVSEKQGDLNSFAFGITVMFFVECVLRSFFGISLKSIFNNIGEKITLTTVKKTVTDTMSNSTNSWIVWIVSSTPFVGILKLIYALLYWFAKGYVVFMLVPFAVTLIILYFIYNLFMGIYNNSSDDISISDKIELITRIIYTKLYDVKESNDFIYLVKSIFWFFFFYLYEFIAILVLITGLMTFLKYIDSVEINTVITMFYLFFIVGIVLWSMYKYKILKPKLDDTYQRDENNKQFTFDLFNCKDSYEKNTGNSMFNIFIASDAYNKHIIDEHMAKKKEEMSKNKPSGLQKTFGSMVSFFGDKMQSAKSFVQSNVNNIGSTLNSGIGDVSNLLQSKYEKTKQNATDTYSFLKNTPGNVRNMANSVGNMFTSNNTQR